jgi:uncharacterized membrane protein (UPF0127 family)
MIPWRVLSRRALGVLAIGAAAAALVLAPACKNAGERRPSATAGDGAAAADTRSAAVFIDVGASRVVFRVELARTPAEHEVGLMFRKNLEPDAGMLFLFDRPSLQTFWMKNTLIPLDMIFISADRQIVGIVANAEPQTLTARRVDEVSQYVLEIGGGLAAARGIRTGQRVEFRGVDGP